MNKISWQNELAKLQNEYLSVLKEATINVDNENFSYIVDEINTFWFANRNIVELILDVIANEKQDAYLFTGATYVDVKNNELYPFISLGTFHVIDDSVSNLGKFLEEIPNPNFKMNVKEVVTKAAKDNIEIIEKYGKFLFILPLTILTQDKEYDLMRKGADNLFISLFKDNVIINVDDYFNKFKTIEQVFCNLTNVAKKTIIFTEHDTPDNLLENFNRFKKSQKYPLPTTVDDLTLFKSIIKSYFMRAMSIVIMCTKYNLIPYLRYLLIFQYFILITDSLKSNECFADIILKSKYAYIMHRIFDRNRIQNISLENFNSKLIKSNFYSIIIDDLSNIKKDKYNITVKEIDAVLIKHLNKLAY